LTEDGEREANRTSVENSIERWIETSKGQLDRSWIRSLDIELDREMEKELY